MDFPHDWAVLAAEEFETAVPRVNGDVTMEVLAQLRPSGRILDNFRVALAGSKALDFDADLFSLIPAAIFKGWRVKGQCWARDVAIRANVFSSGWIDLAATIAMRELASLMPRERGSLRASFFSSTTWMKTARAQPATDLRSSLARTTNLVYRSRVCRPQLFSSPGKLSSKGKTTFLSYLRLNIHRRYNSKRVAAEHILYR
jgi:hypothetical protein